MDFLPLLEAKTRFIGLHAVRVLMAMSVLPAFGSGSASRYVKLALGLFLGVTVGIARSDDGWLDPGWHPLGLGIAVMREGLFGFILGWLGRFWLEVCRMAGGLISNEMGLNTANQIDPTSGQSVPLIGFLYETVGLILFFGMRGHHALLGGLVRSFDGVPPGAFNPDDRVLWAISTFVTGLVETSLRVAAPVFVVLVLTSVMVGFMARVAPQWHVLDSSYSIRIGVALIVIVLTLPHIRPLLEHVMDVSHDQLEVLFANE